MTKLKNPYCLGYVHIHSEEEADKFAEAMNKLGLTNYDDWGETSPGKLICDECGWEVRDHKEDGTCPGQ